MSEAKQQRVWIPDADRVFVQGELVAGDDPATVRLPDGTTREVAIKDVGKVNPAQFDRADDIAELTYLNEASVLHNLSTRYAGDRIYTYSGLFLVAVNPYKMLPIYDAAHLERYRNKARDDVAPHIYAVADAAFRQMLETHENQSILITGESGAGKTENTKRTIQYLSAITSGGAHAVAASSGTAVAEPTIDEKVLQTNPVLEAFGNAQTVRNNNSSRFGKFIRVEFTTGGEICGASIDWYLLEKSRVVAAAPAERNYHVFYQLLKGAPAELRKRLLLPASASPADFAYLAHTAPTIAGVDDARDFKELTSAFGTMGVTTETVEAILGIVAGVLHLGNIEVIAQNSEQGRLAKPEQAEAAAALLGVAPQALADAVLRPRVRAGRELVTQARTAAQGRAALDALAKTTYERLFGYVVDQLNARLRDSVNYGERSSFIGVLDIAGFEIFEHNSFEQLCINYTNEKLQQFFNHHMFVLEQEEYVKEQIEWDYVDFGADLQPTIDLIEKANPMGIFSCLDEDCVMPRSTDQTFTDKLADKWTNKNPKFRPARSGQGFIVSHYAAPVEYATDGWLEKNRDPLSEPLAALLEESSNALVRTLFGAEVAKTSSPESGSPVRPVPRRGVFRTVAQRYKEQLVSLMAQLESTHPHFVRCIVPNAGKRAGAFSNRLVLEQLRCNGVLEGIRIARSGFPNRLEFREFLQRYGVLAAGEAPIGAAALAKPASAGPADQRACASILRDLQLNPATYKVGLTKVFFRNGVLAELEEQRDALIAKHTAQFQVVARGYLARQRVRQLKLRRQAVQTIAQSVRSAHEMRRDPWWRLFMAMRPLLQSKESMEATRRDMRTQKLEKTVERLTAEVHTLRADRKELEDERETLRAARSGAEMIAADKEEILLRTQAHLAELEAKGRQLAADAEAAELAKKEAAEDAAGLKDKLRRAAEHLKTLVAERIAPEDHDAAIAKGTELEAKLAEAHAAHKKASDEATATAAVAETAAAEAARELKKARTAAAVAADAAKLTERERDAARADAAAATTKLAGLERELKAAKAAVTLAEAARADAVEAAKRDVASARADAAAARNAKVEAARDLEGLRAQASKVTAAAAREATLLDELATAKNAAATARAAHSKLEREHADVRTALGTAQAAARDAERSAKTQAEEAAKAAKAAAAAAPPARIAELEVALAAAEARAERAEADARSVRTHAGDGAMLFDRLEKVQREKAALVEENSRLRFAGPGASPALGGPRLDSLQAAELRKLQSEVKILKLKLVKSDKDRQRAEAAAGGAFGGAAAGIATGRPMSAPLSVPPTRALRVISGNDRRVSGSHSERALSKLATAAGTAATAGDDVTELAMSLDEERARSAELAELLAQFRRRADEYQTRVDTATVLVEHAKRGQEAARTELASARAAADAAATGYERELAATNDTVSLLRRELHDREVELLNAKRSLTRTRSAQDERSGAAGALQGQLHALRVALDEISAERDRVLADKHRLERRLAGVWSGSNPASPNPGAADPSDLQDKLDRATADHAAAAALAAELKSQLARRERMLEQLREDLRTANKRVAEQDDALATAAERASLGQVELRRAQRELAASNEAVLRAERELEQFKLRHERARAAPRADRPADRAPAFV